jgi:hypothetical protein
VRVVFASRVLISTVPSAAVHLRRSCSSPRGHRLSLAWRWACTELGDSTLCDVVIRFVVFVVEMALNEQVWPVRYSLVDSGIPPRVVERTVGR